MYIMYDAEDNDTTVGVYDTIAEIANALELKPNHVSSIISKKSKYKQRYRIVRIQDDPEEDEGEI